MRRYFKHVQHDPEWREALVAALKECTDRRRDWNETRKAKRSARSLCIQAWMYMTAKQEEVMVEEKITIAQSLYQAARECHDRLADHCNNLVRGREEFDLQVALQIGVPSPYLHKRVECKVTGRYRKRLHVFIGVCPEVSGDDGHGHIVIDSEGIVRYLRNPCELRGPQNYMSYEQTA